MEVKPLTVEYALWNMLHDGSITDVEGSVPGDVTVAVEIEYLRSMLPEPGTRFLIRLCGCTQFEFRRFIAEETLVSDLTTVAAEEPEILSAQLRDHSVVVCMTRGAGPYMELHLQYENLSVFLENGRPVPTEELDDAARRYWEDFDN